MYPVTKRTFDIIASFLALVVLSPVLIIIGLVVKITSTGPIFYRATRVGQNGKPFKLYKFRSMVANADKIGPGVTGAHDARVTRFGKLLRQTKLDELPQLLNVLKGEMSFVGPRPEDPRYVALYTPEQRSVLHVRPGITSLASVQYRNEEQLLEGINWEEDYINSIMPAKLAIDAEYVVQSSILYDLQIILLTLKALFR